jgi:hypothetical protein
MRREVAHIDRCEVGYMGVSREMPRRGTGREVSRIAARVEVARIAGYRDLIRSPDQQGAARRRRMVRHAGGVQGACGTHPARPSH